MGPADQTLQRTGGDSTAEGPGPERMVSADLFREAMSRLGAAVHIITTAGPSGRTGFTATAVCSVSDQPPTLLVCLNKAALTTPLLIKNGVFCVNTLSKGQESVAGFFAKSSNDKAAALGGPEWLQMGTGCYALESAAIGFDCRIVEMKAVASHNVIFGAIEDIRLGPADPALVYHQRAYKHI